MLATTLLCLGLFWLPLTAWADEVQVNGRAVDENGVAVASAQVRFRIEGTPPRGDIQATTGPTGGFSLRLPFQGRWQLTVRCHGFFPLEKQGIEIRAGPQDLHLILHRWREVYQSVQVNAEPAALDLSRTDEQKTLNRSNLLYIPFSGRDLRGAMKPIPGVVQDSKEGLHFSGSLPNQVAYTLDGFNISDPLTGRFTTHLNVDSVRSVEYSTGRFSRGGFVNITNHQNPTVVNDIIGAPQFMQFFGSQGRHVIFHLRWIDKNGY
jgi:hypothetical protein